MIDKSKNEINTEQVDVDVSRAKVSKKDDRYYLQFTNCVYKERLNWQTYMLCFFIVYKLDDYLIVNEKKELNFLISNFSGLHSETFHEKYHSISFLADKKTLRIRGANNYTADFDNWTGI